MLGFVVHAKLNTPGLGRVGNPVPGVQEWAGGGLEILDLRPWSLSIVRHQVMLLFRRQVILGSYAFSFMHVSPPPAKRKPKSALRY